MASDGMQQHGTRRTLARTPWSVGLAALALAGCAAGPDYRKPDSPAVAAYAAAQVGETSSADATFGASQRLLQGVPVPKRWWTLFGAQQLDSLVERAFKFNPTIESAHAALRQGQELVAAQRGFFFPTIQAAYYPSRTKLAGNMGGNSPGVQGDGTLIQTYSNPGGPAPYNAPVIYTFHTSQLSIAYTADVFGGLRRQVESLEAQAESLGYQVEATYLTLASNVVAAAIQEASLRAQITAANRLVESAGRSLAIVRDQQKFGYAMGLDVAAQESALAQAQALLPPLQMRLAQTRDLIRVLAGNLPAEDVDETFDFAGLVLPTDLPLGVPSQLVLQRPDVRAAQATLHALTAQVGVARAARLPQFTLTGAVGGMASQFNQMYKAGGPFFNLVGGALQTLFDGGTLMHLEGAARQALTKAAADYRTAVLNAYQNVADTLYAIQYDAEALAAAANAEKAARRTLYVSRAQVEAGLVNALTVLAAEQTYQQAVLTLVQAQAQRFGDTAALFQALGGGRWTEETAAR